MSFISRYGVDWYKEYNNNSGDKDKVNPVRLIAEVGANSDKIGFDCENGEQKGKDYFEECDKTAGIVNDKKAKVVRVLKKTYDKSRSEYYIPKKDGGSGWAGNHTVSQDIINKHRQRSQNTGWFGPLVAEKCPQFPGFGPLPSMEAEFCKQVLKQFFGTDVENERYCLYEMPETEGISLRPRSGRVF